MRKIVLALRLSGTMWAAMTAPAFANHDCDDDVCFTQAESPEWVMVFSLDGAGQLVLENRSRSAEYMVAGSVLHNRSGWRRGCDDAPAYRIVVTSDQPFCLPRGFKRHQGFHVRSHWKSDHTRKLCRMLGVRPGSVRVIATGFDPYYEEPRHHQVYPHGDWPWSQVDGADRIYVDGSFRGNGFDALIDVSVGPHRVTVVTGKGRKHTRWVTFPSGSCGNGCSLAYR